MMSFDNLLPARIDLYCTVYFSKLITSDYFSVYSVATDKLVWSADNSLRGGVPVGCYVVQPSGKEGNFACIARQVVSSMT
jgi:hypothetical protein